MFGRQPLEKLRNKSTKKSITMYQRDALAHYFSGVGSLIGSFFPVSSESLGLPSIHEPSIRKMRSWIDDGIQIRKMWISSVGLELSDAKPKHSIHSTFQLPIRFP